MATKIPLKIESGNLQQLSSTDTIPVQNLASGTATSSVFLRGDGTWAIPDVSAPTVPDQMILLDSIAGFFNGSLTQFTLKTSNVNFINTELASEARLIISVGGTIQAPDPTQGAGFYLSGGTDRTTDPVKINFVEAPRAGQTFFGIVIKSTVSAVVPYVSNSTSIAYAIALGA